MVTCPSAFTDEADLAGSDRNCLISSPGRSAILAWESAIDAAHDLSSRSSRIEIKAEALFFNTTVQVWI
jgi:hypothetical protein